MSLDESIRVLRQKVGRWGVEVSTGEIRGTTLSGIAGRAALGFEDLIKDHLDHFVRLGGLDYESELAPTFRGKTLQKLTLGDVVRSFDMVGGKLSRLLGRKDLPFSTAHKSRLKKITELRNYLIHTPVDKLAKHDLTLLKKTRSLLSLIQEELSEPLFQSAAPETPRSAVDL